MTTTPTTAAPDAVRVAHDIAVQVATSGKTGRVHQMAYDAANEGALLAFHAVQEAMSAQGGGEVPDGWVLVPLPGAEVRSSHPRTALNPDATFEVHAVEVDSWGARVRGERTCWFGVKMISPALPAPEVKDAEARPCTCHPDDQPPEPCAQKYALSECKAPAPAPAASDELVERVKRAVQFLASNATGMNLVQWNEISNDLLATIPRIEANAAEIKRWMNWHGQSNRRRLAAEAERDALREALSALVIESGGKAIPNMSLTAARENAMRVLGQSRAALRPEAKGGREDVG